MTVSEQWQKLTQEQFQQIDAAFLRDFRAPGAKNKFVAWDPFERSSRYLKFLLLNAATQQAPAFFDAYRKVEGRALGNPLSVKVAGCEVDADYLAAVEEHQFLLGTGTLDGVRRVVEIGAGFGRTCHTLLTLVPSIEEYVIVDLPPMLRLSQAYLAAVRPDANVRFVGNDDAAAIEGLTPDLVVNIDSFQEMPKTVIDDYFARIVAKASLFYCKNPIGKYLPGSIGQPDLTPAQLMDVFKLGYCQEVIDIFDSDALAKARRRFLEVYCPRDMSVRAEQPMALFSYFHHALFARP